VELRVAFRTLGCKLNQLETESLADAFKRSGWTVVEGREALEAGVVLFILNTCTVTGKAEQKARRLVRQALAANPVALAIVTGCYAQVEAEALADLHERALVVAGERKSLLLGLPARLADEWQGHGDLREAVQAFLRSAESGEGGELDPFAFIPEDFSFHSRPSLKVQDGCDNRCSYCRVRIARGSARSLPVAQVLERLQALEATGKAEAVLTGVNLYQYRDGAVRFPGLLRALLAGTRSIALRLSSWEPEGVDDEFLEVFAEGRIRPHVHLPVQSGSDAVLRGMARAYRRDKVLAACEALRRVRDDPFIAADLIAGFPGEGELEFADTLDLARRCDFAWIHAFPFSPRPGTVAWAMVPRVPERVAGDRVAALSTLAREGRGKFVERQIGSEVAAVLETGKGPVGNGLLHATSENYLRLLVRGLPEGFRGGSAFRCLIEGRVSRADVRPDSAIVPARSWLRVASSPATSFVKEGSLERETGGDEGWELDLFALYREN
jgi:threonylcarbamoyladenosine tRNA methylthiotransferase MtaB